jgi:hypothetical protein
MGQDPNSSRWRGVHGGEIDHLYVGAYVVDQSTGACGQIEAIYEDNWVQLRYEDGRSVRVRVLPGDPAAARAKYGSP